MPLKDKEAHKKYCREYYHKKMEEPPDKVPAYSKEYYGKHREKLILKSRKNHLRISYNLTMEEYALLVEGQNNLCYICEQPETRLLKTGQVKPLSIDHNHTTGKVRKLLCNDCNAALGFAKESPKLLKKMASYLKEHNE